MDFKMLVLSCGFNDYFKYKNIHFRPKKLPAWLDEGERVLYLKGWDYAKLLCSSS